jgi:uncharacterized repeat protein (TIGR01451 family)
MKGTGRRLRFGGRLSAVGTGLLTVGAGLAVVVMVLGAVTVPAVAAPAATVDVVLTPAPSTAFGGAAGTVTGAVFSAETGASPADLTPIGGAGASCTTVTQGTDGTCQLSVPAGSLWIVETTTPTGDAPSQPTEVTAVSGQSVTATIQEVPADCTATSTGQAGTCNLTETDAAYHAHGQGSYQQVAAGVVAITLPTSQPKELPSTFSACVGPVNMTFALAEATPKPCSSGTLAMYGATSETYLSSVQTTVAGPITYDIAVPSGDSWLVQVGPCPCGRVLVMASPDPTGSSVPKAPSSTSTMAHGVATLGQGTATDVATVTGEPAAGAAPSGKVMFYVCGSLTSSPTACDAASAQVETLVPLTAGAAGTATATATSPPLDLPDPGYYCFFASYAGDGIYEPSYDDATNECFDVLPAQALVTTSTTGVAEVGSGSATDVATVTGQGTTLPAAPSGTVTFAICYSATADPTSCTTSTAGAQIVGSPVDLVASSATVATATSDPFAPKQAGYYCFAALYGGNSLYSSSADTASAANGAAADPECFHVTSPVPYSPPPVPVVPVTSPSVSTSTTTQVSSSTVDLGAAIHDTAQVTSATGAPTGTVTFWWCGPESQATTCSPTTGTEVGGSPATLVPQTGVDQSVATSASVTPSALGTYCFAAQYTPASGSADTASSDNMSGTPQTDECVRVVAPKLTGVKQSDPASGGKVFPGTDVTYTITLSNAGTAPADDVTVYDTVPTGTTYVAGSATCPASAGSSCSVDESAGAVTWSGVDVPAMSGTVPATVAFTFLVRVTATIPGTAVTNVAHFTDEGTPNCTTPTCPTNLVTLTVQGAVVPPVILAQHSAQPSTQPSVLPVSIAGATTVHTGEPWAGSGPVVAAIGAAGALLVGIGVRRRRRRHVRTSV